jgi:hypothetical protein
MMKEATDCRGLLLADVLLRFPGRLSGQTVETIMKAIAVFPGKPD